MMLWVTFLELPLQLGWPHTPQGRQRMRHVDSQWATLLYSALQGRRPVDQANEKGMRDLK